MPITGGKARHIITLQNVKKNITDIKGVLKQKFDIFGNAIISFLAETLMRRSLMSFCYFDAIQLAA